MEHILEHRAGPRQACGSPRETTAADVAARLDDHERAARGSHGQLLGCRAGRHHFSRHFRKGTGTSPARWRLAQRLDRARTLLETSDLPVARIAAEPGFAGAITFR